MADMLVMMPSHTPHEDGPGAWKAGMCVDVYPDGQLGPGLEQHPKFFVVRITGCSVDDAREFLEDLSEDTLTYAGIDGDGEPIMEPGTRMVHRRLNYFDFDNIPNPHRDLIDTFNEITMANINTLRSWMRPSADRA